MNRKSIKVTIDKTTKQYNASYDEEKDIYRYKEIDQSQTEMIVDFKKKTIIRKNSSLYLKLPFSLKTQKKVVCKIAGFDKDLELNLETLNLEVTDKSFIVKYKIEESIVSYQLIVEGD